MSNANGFWHRNFSFAPNKPECQEMRTNSFLDGSIVTVQASQKANALKSAETLRSMLVGFLSEVRVANGSYQRSYYRRLSAAEAYENRLVGAATQADPLLLEAMQYLKDRPRLERPLWELSQVTPVDYCKAVYFAVLFEAVGCTLRGFDLELEHTPKMITCYLKSSSS